MAVKLTRQNSLYGYPNSQANQFPDPVVTGRAPTGYDQGVIGQQWVDNSNNAVYTLTSISGGSSVWSPAGGGSVVIEIDGDSGSATPANGVINIVGSSGNGVSFVASGDTVECQLDEVVASSFTALSGDVTIDAGDLEVTLGNITLGAGDMTLTNGTVFVNGIDGGISCDGSAGVGTGWITMNNGASIEVRSPGKLYASTASITGDEGSGAGETSFTNVTVAAAPGGGSLTIDSNSAGSGTNAGFLKAYVGTTVIYLPYFTDVAP